MVRHVVKIDVDDAARLPLGTLVRRLIRANRRLVCLAECRSPSGRGWHQWLTVRPAPRTATETVALQLLCGSDPGREAYNLNRATVVDRTGVTVPWNVLYRRSVKHPPRKGR